MSRRRSMTLEILAETQAANRAMQDINRRTGEMGESFSRTGRVVRNAISVVAAGAVVQFGRDMATHGALIEGVERRTDTVFGAMRDDVRTWASEQHEAFGLSESGLLNLASAFGDLLVPMGFTRRETAELTKETLEAANALSEWTGGQVPVEKAAEAVSKAMLGEREMLKELGISIKETDIAQRLLEKGQKDLTGAALEQAKALATQELIFEKSADALSAYAEGGNEALRAQKEVAAAAAELRDDLARRLLPVLTDVTKGIGNFAKGIEVIVDWFDSLPDSAKTAALGIAGIGAALAVVYANPVVAGLALVAGAVAKIGSDARTSEQTIADLRRELEELGAVSNDTILSFFTPDQLREIEEAGVSWAELITAVRDGGDAYAAVEEKIRSANKWAWAGARIGDDLVGTMDNLRGALTEVEQGLEEEAAAQQKAQADAVSHRDALLGQLAAAEDLDPTILGLTRRETELGAATQTTAEKVDAARKATIELATARAEAASPVLALFGAEQRHAEALARVNELQAEGKTDTEEYAKALIDLISTQGDLEGAQARVAVTTGESLAAFRAQAEAAGLSKDEIDELIRKIQQYNVTKIGEKTFLFTVSGGGAFKVTPSGATALHLGGIAQARPGGVFANIAEGGSDEAVIPLNQRGAEFMAAVLAKAGGAHPAASPATRSGLTEQTIIVEIPGVGELTRAVLRNMPDLVRLHTGIR